MLCNDNLNINRIFPGNENGSVSEKIAHFIATKIIPVSDVFLDAHSGDANEDLLPFVCYYDNKNYPFQTKMAKELSEYSGFENVISYPYTIKINEPALYAFKQASQVGKIALSFESGKLGYLQPKAVDRILRGYYGVRIFKTDLRGKSDSLHLDQNTGLIKLLKLPLIRKDKQILTASQKNGKNPVLWFGKSQMSGDKIFLTSNSRC